MSEDEKKLNERIKELEAEVLQREQDLARFRSELMQTNGQLEGLIKQVSKELKTAQAVYRALVPTEFPHISGFEFSTKFVPSLISGGDYFDIFEHQDRMRFGVVLSSASGHSLSALLLSVLIKMAGQMEGRRLVSPEKVVNSMEEELQPHLDENSHLDLFYGVVNRRDYIFSYVNRGNVLLIHQEEGGALSLPKEKDLPIQKSGEVGKGSRLQSLALAPRDRLILVSPGCLLAENLKGEAFGWERVSRAIKAAPSRGVHELRQNLLFEIESFSKGAELRRDLTILAVEVKDKVIKLAPNK
ncbi:SpoIIE family protein phosphatase [bacterium]|nr:SpoIIE family protein phosphatase [bacterium]